MQLTDRISSLKGIGPKKAESFAAAGIETLEDFLHFFPRKYEDRRTVTPAAKLSPGKDFLFAVCRKSIQKKHTADASCF